jgi:hypothetical protein
MTQPSSVSHRDRHPLRPPDAPPTPSTHGSPDSIRHTPRAAGARVRRFPAHAVAVTDQEGVWEWFRSRDAEKARRRAWRYAEALARCGGARVLPVTVIEAGRAGARAGIPETAPGGAP